MHDFVALKCPFPHRAVTSQARGTRRRVNIRAGVGSSIARVGAIDSVNNLLGASVGGGRLGLRVAFRTEYACATS